MDEILTNRNFPQSVQLVLLFLVSNKCPQDHYYSNKNTDGGNKKNGGSSVFDNPENGIN